MWILKAAKILTHQQVGPINHTLKNNYPINITNDKPNQVEKRKEFKKYILPFLLVEAEKVRFISCIIVQLILNTCLNRIITLT